MGHAFDTGFPKPLRTRIREAIVARLSPLLISSTPAMYAKAIVQLPTTYRGESDGDGLLMLMQAAERQGPAIGVGLGDKPYGKQGLEVEDLGGTLDIGVYAWSVNQRDLVTGRLGPDALAGADLKADPGLEIMLEHIEQLLIGHQLRVANPDFDPDDEDSEAIIEMPGVGVLQFVEEQIVTTQDKFTIGGFRLTVEVARWIDPARSVAQLATSIEVNTTPDTSPNLPADPPLVNTVTNLDPEE